MGVASLSAYRGDVVLARAAAAENIPMAMSGSSLIRLEDVAQANPAAWFQAYLPGDEARFGPLIDRVARAGFGTLVVTVDVAVLSNRENNIRAGFSTPLRPSTRLAWDAAIHPRWLFGNALRTWVTHGMPHFENSSDRRGAPILARGAERDFSGREALDGKSLEAIRQRWKGTLVVKGILDARDARRAQEAGVDGVIVSNHGGRQLDGAVAALRVLPAIAARKGSMAVMLDGGIRRGTDVLKALALGADFVWVGRPFNYAAAVAGEAGVRHAARILAEEIGRDMALAGVTALGELGPGHLLRIAPAP
jgi:L-lactate dehydrogenase (cytochrome)